MIEKVFAATALAACVVLMVRLLVSPQRRYRFDMAVRLGAYRARLWAMKLFRWRTSRKEAERLAEEAIRRARAEGTWDGNVYKPKTFKRPRKPH